MYLPKDVIFPLTLIPQSRENFRNHYIPAPSRT